MSLQDVSAYWKDWVSKDQEGDPFSFFSLDDNSDRDKGKGANDGDRDNGDGGAQEGAMEQPPSPPDNYLPDDHFSVDDDIPLPLSCKTPSQRTSCLQQLIYDHGEPNKTFHKLVKAVDTLEVSSISMLGSAILPPSRVPEWNPRTLYVVCTYLSFISDWFPPRFQTYLPRTVHYLISPSSLPFTC